MLAVNPGGYGQCLGGAGAGLGLGEAQAQIRMLSGSFCSATIRRLTVPGTSLVCSQTKGWLCDGFQASPHGAPCPQVSTRSP